MSPAPTLDDPAAYFDRLAAVEDAHWWPRAMARIADAWLDRALAGRRGLRALDLGCGAGGTLRRLRNRAEIALAVGLEPSPEALGHARVSPFLPLVRGDALASPFPDQSFDLITCFDVLQHLPEGSEAAAAAEIARLLRPGGVALVRSNGRGWARADRGSIRPYRLEELADAISAGGLVVRRATYANSLPALAQELRGRWSPRRGSHPSGGGLQIAPPSHWLRPLVQSIAFTEADLAGRLGVRLPFGHSTLILAGRRG